MIWGLLTGLDLEFWVGLSDLVFLGIEGKLGLSDLEMLSALGHTVFDRELRGKT